LVIIYYPSGGLTTFNGRGGESIHVKKFAENFKLKHEGPFLLEHGKLWVNVFT
jgi:hypothetical protein